MKIKSYGKQLFSLQQAIEEAKKNQAELLKEDWLKENYEYLTTLPNPGYSYQQNTQENTMDHRTTWCVNQNGTQSVFLWNESGYKSAEAITDEDKQAQLGLLLAWGD